MLLLHLQKCRPIFYYFRGSVPTLLDDHHMKAMGDQVPTLPAPDYDDTQTTSKPSEFSKLERTNTIECFDKIIAQHPLLKGVKI